ncbi:hypothetical protein J7E62_09365 [Variovorax paradoxus]|nr:hypothetical protein [Variovorax paradoxus]
MDYEEAIETTVTRAQALAEIAKHDIGEPIESFFADCGDKATYTGAEVLGWLGY